MIEILQNRWFLIAVGLLILLGSYWFLFLKDKTLELLEREYAEVIHSDKYKVKGQHD